MTPDQVMLVQSSFAAIAPRAEAVAVMFYEELFARDPALRAMFPGDMAEQRGKLVRMLATAVQELGRPQAIVPALEALGRQHAGYGVMDAHYATVGAALLATLAKGLGAGFYADVEAAWTACYDLVATTMRDATMLKAA